MRDFIEKLAKTTAPKNAINPWDYSSNGNDVRRKNLEGYLNAMHKRKPEVLLVGEAPGYRGCGRVGMPFSSEKLLLSHSFFANREQFNVVNKDDVIAEASASIVWKTLDSLSFYPLMWATYPFHPHQPGNVHTNRAPRPEEIELGKAFLTELVERFRIKHLVAVGRIAEKCLDNMGYEAYPVRHPSHGGAVLFAEGLRKFIAKI